MDRRRSLIEPEHRRLGVVRQGELVGIARSSFYYRPVGESQANLRLMRLMDEMHLQWPWYGSRQMARALRRMGHRVGRKRVRRLMRVMGLRSLASRPNTSRRAPGRAVYPYLLRNLEVCRPNQAWCADLTYVPMAHGFLYLVAIMDWFSRKVMSWGLSTTQDTALCVGALEEAIEQHGVPEILNTDQGSRWNMGPCGSRMKARTRKGTGLPFQTWTSRGRRRGRSWNCDGEGRDGFGKADVMRVARRAVLKWTDAGCEWLGRALKCA